MNKTNYITLAFIVSLVATLGSLFFSDVMQYTPCSLCWYQRIFMYPLVLIFIANLLYPDDSVYKYAMPVVVVGLIIAFYHNLLVWGIVSEDISPCRSGVPCSVKYIDWFGFINIQLLSLVAFLIIFIILILSKKAKNEK